MPASAPIAGTRSRTLLPQLAVVPGHVLWRAAARADQTLAEVLPAGVEIHGYAVLAALAGLTDGEAWSQRRLADSIGVSRTTMTKVAADLSTRGLVERVRNPEDRRSNSLTTTPAGVGAVAEWGPHVDEAERVLLLGFTTEERRELHRLLLAIAEPILSAGLMPAVRARSGFLIVRLHAHLHAEVTAALQDLDLEPRHLGTLVVLSAVAPMAQAELARQLGISSPTVVEITDHLERRGLLERRRDQTDRRTHALHLLPGADEVVEQASERSRSRTSRAFAPLTTDQAHRLLGLLVRVITGPSAQNQQ